MKMLVQGFPHFFLKAPFKNIEITKPSSNKISQKTTQDLSTLFIITSRIFK